MGKILLFVNASEEFVLNILSQNGIKVMDFSMDKYPRFYVNSCDIRRIKEIFARHNKTVNILSDRTFRAFFKKNIVRAGLFSALILTFIFAYFYSLKVTDIVISGNSIVSTGEIEKVIFARYDFPADKKEVDTGLLIKEVTMIDGISSSAVFIKGKTLFCTVFEELPKVDVVDKSDFAPVVSFYDAIVTRVIVFDGQAAVKKGDTVKKDQTLIDATVVIDEEKGLFTKTKPLGEVYGRVWVTETSIFYPTVVRRVRTGSSKTTVRFFNDDFKQNTDFVLYEREVTSRILDPSMPIKVYIATDYEVEEREEEFDFESNADGIIKEATRSIEARLPEGSEKVRTWFEIKRLDKSVRLDIYYEIEIKIS